MVQSLFLIIDRHRTKQRRYREPRIMESIYQGLIRTRGHSIEEIGLSHLEFHLRLKSYYNFGLVFQLKDSQIS